MDGLCDFRAIGVCHLEGDSHFRIIVDMKREYKIARLKEERTPTTKGSRTLLESHFRRRKQSCPRSIKTERVIELDWSTHRLASTMACPGTKGVCINVIPFV